MLLLNVLPLFQPGRLASFLIDEHECIFMLIMLYLCCFVCFYDYPSITMLKSYE